MPTRGLALAYPRRRRDEGSAHRDAGIGHTPYLNDAVLMAPSMLLRPTVSFTDVDDRSFDVTLADHGQTVTHESFWTTTGARSTSAPPTGTPTSPAAWSRRNGPHPSTAGRPTPTASSSPAAGPSGKSQTAPWTTWNSARRRALSGTTSPPATSPRHHLNRETRPPGRAGHPPK